MTGCEAGQIENTFVRLLLGMYQKMPLILTKLPHCSIFTHGL